MSQCQQITQKGTRCTRHRVRNGLCGQHLLIGIHQKEDMRELIESLNAEVNREFNIISDDSSMIHYLFDIDHYSMAPSRHIIREIIKKETFCFKFYLVNDKISEYCDRLCKGNDHIICGNRQDQEVDLLLYANDSFYGENWLFIYTDENIEKFKKKIKADPVLMMLNLEIFLMRRSREPKVLMNRCQDIHFLFV